MMTMKGGVAAITMLVLVGCSSPAEKARKKYEFLQANGGTLGEVCDAGRQMLDAQAAAQDKGQPEDRAIVDVDCMTAEMKGRAMPANQDDPVYSITADNMDAIADSTGPAASATPTAKSAQPSQLEGEEEPDENGEIGRNEWHGE